MVADVIDLSRLKGDSLQTTIAQAATLTIFGNDRIHGQARDDFWPAASVFRSCRTVRFVVLNRSTSLGAEQPFAQNPPEWVAKLVSQEVVGFRIHCFPRNAAISDRMSAGFVGGGGRWLIETMRQNLSDVWEARWLVGNKDDPERKIWDVTYGRIDKDRTRLPATTANLADLRRDLAAALTAIKAFANRQKLDVFAKTFREAQAALSSDTPFDVPNDIAPADSLSLPAKQLLAAAQARSVFGGMGSWNDLGFDGPDQQEYEQRSDALFSLLNQAICAAVNSAAP